MHRFFVSPQTLHDGVATLSGAQAHQVNRVLRLRPGARIVLLDDTGWAYEAELERVGPGQVVARVLASSQPATESRVRLVLCQALAREAKFDWVLQKGTELGVSRFVPLLVQRSLVRLDERGDARRWGRWQRIVTEAAEQAGRARLPLVAPTQTLAQACVALPPGGLALIACLSAEAVPLGRVLRALEGRFPAEVRLFIGPEGDFTPDEVAQVQRAGGVSVSLGPRVLRTETAGLAGLAAILYALGEMG